ncbi:chaplin family protein [Actinomadura gamaensis]|uniref:Chaplin family protein n=1 Tax=Actinomadura gamaensis TaxID=1763541 RepID=A0ABV9U3B9_9ACTN
MRNWAKNVSRAALVAAGLAAVGAGLPTGAALAETTNGDYSVLGGNQLYAPISVPVNFSGNALGVLGVANAKSVDGAHVLNFQPGDSRDGVQTSGEGSVGGGNQLYAPISAPLNICGNDIAVAAVTNALCRGSASVDNIVAGHRAGYPDGSRGGDAALKTSGKYSVLGGNQAYLPVSVPVNLCGNAGALLGAANGHCFGSASVRNFQLGGHRVAPLPSTRRVAGPQPSAAQPMSAQQSSSARPPEAGGRPAPGKQPLKVEQLAAGKKPASARQMPPVARALRNVVRKLGIPVPGPDAPPGPQPSLLKGMPISVAGHRLPFLGG